MNFKKFITMLLVLVGIFSLAACKDNSEVEQKLEEALQSITLSDITSLSRSFVVLDKTNKHQLDIKWEFKEADSTLKVEVIDGKTTIVVTPTPYTENEQGKQTNSWGYGVLKATVEVEGSSKSREWELHVAPGEKDLTINLMKRLKDDEKVTFEGTVIYTGSKGFFLYDGTDSIYVFTSSAPANNVLPGAKVLVSGKKVTYYDMPQISSPTVEVVEAAPTGGFDYTNIPEVSISLIANAQRKDLEAYGRVAKITGQVIKDYKSPANGTVVSEYAILDVLTGDVAPIYDSTSKDVKNFLATRVDKYVSLVVVAYDNHSQQLVWRCYGVEGTVKEVSAPIFSDEDIIKNLKNKIETMFKDKSFATDLNLITTGSLGGSVTWTSSNPDIIANDGKITIPVSDTEITLTYKIKSNELEEEYSLKVTALTYSKMTIREALTQIDTSERLVYVEGIIIGTDTEGYYFLADETGVVFVRQKLSENNLVVGNKVEVKGMGIVFTGNNSAQYTRQISGNYTVTKVDEQLHQSPLAVVDVEFTDFDSTIKEGELKAKVPNEDLLGKVVKIHGFVSLITSGNYTDTYIVASKDANPLKLIVFYNSLELELIKSLNGKEVTFTAVVYDYHVAYGWRLSFINQEDHLLFNLTDQEKLDYAKPEIETVVSNDKAVSADLDLFLSAKNPLLPNVKYTWTSNNTAIIANDGKFTAPTTETTVEITVKVFLDGNTAGTPSAEWKYTIIAKAEGEPAGGVMISQVYGGGGNAGATLKSDFIELYNSSDQDIDITGWVIWYASLTGDFKAIGSQSYQTGYVLTGVIKAKSFFLIKASDGTSGSVDLPTPDDTSTLGLGGTGFKVALTNNSTVPTGPNNTNIVDFVAAGAANLYEGSGPAAAPSNTTAVIRSTLTDTNDNKADFIVGAPNPRNSSYVK